MTGECCVIEEVKSLNKIFNQSTSFLVVVFVKEPVRKLIGKTLTNSSLLALFRQFQTITDQSHIIAALDQYGFL